MFLFLLEKYCRYRPSTLHSPYIVDITVWWASLSVLVDETRAYITYDLLSITCMQYWFRDKKC